MIRKLKSDQYRLYSRRKNRKRADGAISARSRAAPQPEKHERAAQYFKHR